MHSQHSDKLTSDNKVYIQDIIIDTTSKNNENAAYLGNLYNNFKLLLCDIAHPSHQEALNTQQYNTSTLVTRVTINKLSTFVRPLTMSELTHLIAWIDELIQTAAEFPDFIKNIHISFGTFFVATPDQNLWHCSLYVVMPCSLQNKPAIYFLEKMNSVQNSFQHTPTASPAIYLSHNNLNLHFPHLHFPPQNVFDVAINEDEKLTVVYEINLDDQLLGENESAYRNHVNGCYSNGKIPPQYASHIVVSNQISMKSVTPVAETNNLSPIEGFRPIEKIAMNGHLGPIMVNYYPPRPISPYRSAQQQLFDYIHCARRLQLEKIPPIYTLIQRDACANVPDKEGYTPAHYLLRQLNEAILGNNPEQTRKLATIASWLGVKLQDYYQWAIKTHQHLAAKELLSISRPDSVTKYIQPQASLTNYSVFKNTHRREENISTNAPPSKKPKHEKQPASQKNNRYLFHNIDPEDHKVVTWHDVEENQTWRRDCNKNGV